MRSRSWLWLLLLIAVVWWTGWTRVEIADQQDRLESLKEEVRQIDALQKYLPGLLRTILAEHEQRMIAILDERCSRDESKD